LFDGGSPVAKTVSIIGLQSFPKVKPGDNLAELIVGTMQAEGVDVADGDVIVVAHKVISKAEGRIAKLRDVEPSNGAQELAKATSRDPRLIELILQETNRIVKASREILIVENRQGFVCINAGVDKSNVEGEDAYTLLPLDPDESARKIRARISKLAGKNVAVVVCDTYSRPFRRGQVEFAIGIAGIKPFRDYRGEKDMFGYVLKVKNSAIADEIAAAAELLMGQGKEALPVVVIKNLNRVKSTDDASAAELLISKQEDLFNETL
jgi:coenzyme F420-0:L-glutamate ligase/coenzyme F420-1:gamma-L-glutamate ligase